MRIAHVLVIVLCNSAAVYGAETVYKTVDEQGVVSFSDVPPEDGVKAETLQVQAPAPLGDEYQENLEAMRETTDRMAADRRERERHQAELRELDARANPPAQTVNYESPDYFPVYGGGYYNRRRDYWYGGRPKPEHPIARPPLRPRPTPAYPMKNNSQLMRPIVSGNNGPRGRGR